MPVKDRRTKLLLLFLLTNTTLTEERIQKFTEVEITEDLQKIFDITINQKTKGTLSSMLKDEVVEKKQEGEKITYILTERGFLEICLIFPFFRYMRHEWDGLWRIISYEIPETKRFIRDRFRREVKGWGLGPWHRSFWVTPHTIISNLRDLVYGKEEAQYIQAFEATHLFGDMEVLVEKVWKKTELEKQYRELFKKWHEILSEDIAKIEKFQKVLYLYIDELRNDPGLPQTLLGLKWIGYDAFSIFSEIRGILLAK